MYVACNWFPSCRLFKNEHLLSAVGSSRTFPKGNWPRGLYACVFVIVFGCANTYLFGAASSLAYLLESDQEMTDKLNNAAMRRLG